MMWYLMKAVLEGLGLWLRNTASEQERSVEEFSSFV